MPGAGEVVVIAVVLVVAVVFEVVLVVAGLTLAVTEPQLPPDSQMVIVAEPLKRPFIVRTLPFRLAFATLGLETEERLYIPVPPETVIVTDCPTETEGLV